MSDDFDALFDDPPTAATPASGAETTPAATPVATATGDDFDALFDEAPTAAKPSTVAPAPSRTAVAVVAEETASPEGPVAPSIWIAIYRSGDQIQYVGKNYTINHVHISRKGLFLRLKDKDELVLADRVQVALTQLNLPLNAYQNPKLKLLPPPPPSPARTK